MSAILFLIITLTLKGLESKTVVNADDTNTTSNMTEALNLPQWHDLECEVRM